MLDSAPHLGFLFFKNYYYCVHDMCCGHTHTVAFSGAQGQLSLELVLAVLRSSWGSDSGCQAGTASASSAEPPCQSTHSAF